LTGRGVKKDRFAGQPSYIGNSFKKREKKEDGGTIPDGKTQFGRGVP